MLPVEGLSLEGRGLGDLAAGDLAVCVLAVGDQAVKQTPPWAVVRRASDESEISTSDPIEPRLEKLPPQAESLRPAASPPALQFVAVDEAILPGRKQPGPAGATRPHPRRMEIPSDLPGADVAPIRLPPVNAQNAEEREKALARLFPQLPDLGPDVKAQAGPQVQPLSLGDLERIARDNSPTVRQAAADIRTAQGNAIQAGLYPNPTVGYEGDNIGTAHTSGFQGGFVEQLIKTGGKLNLAHAAAMMDVANAQVALHRADADLMAKVRGNYFAVLVAQENIRISHALAEFSDETYRVQVDMVKGGQAAAYEPLQLRVLAYQARANLVQARNRYISAWKQLAAALGLPGMPPIPLIGRVDAPVPVLYYDAALARVLSQHTDVQTAENTLEQARINLRLAEANRIPDVTAHVAVQNDPTVPPLDTTDLNLILSAPIPLWDHNQGNIMAADGSLAKALEGPHLARANLVNQVADAYERYQDNMVLVDYYRKQILPDQMQAYRGTRERYEQETDVVQFNDLVTSQQTVAATVTAYVAALGSLWTAVVDMSALLQADDLFQMGELQSLPEVPDLEHLCPLPCCHACQSPPGALGADGNWPPAAPGAAMIEQPPVPPSAAAMQPMPPPSVPTEAPQQPALPSQPPTGLQPEAVAPPPQAPPSTGLPLEAPETPRPSRTR